MSKYNLKFKKKGERGYWHMAITATEEKEAINEARFFIWKREDIEKAYIEEIIYKTKKVWSYEKEDKQNEKMEL
jgi:hypothetical protein